MQAVHPDGGARSAIPGAGGAQAGQGEEEAAKGVASERPGYLALQSLHAHLDLASRRPREHPLAAQPVFPVEPVDAPADRSDHSSV